MVGLADIWRIAGILRGVQFKLCLRPFPPFLPASFPLSVSLFVALSVYHPIPLSLSLALLGDLAFWWQVGRRGAAADGPEKGVGAADITLALGARRPGQRPPHRGTAYPEGRTEPAAGERMNGAFLSVRIPIRRSQKRSANSTVLNRPCKHEALSLRIDTDALSQKRSAKSVEVLTRPCGTQKSASLYSYTETQQ